MYPKCERCGVEATALSTLVQGAGGIKVVLCARCLRVFDAFMRSTPEWKAWCAALGSLDDATRQAEASNPESIFWSVITLKRMLVEDAREALYDKALAWVTVNCKGTP